MVDIVVGGIPPIHNNQGKSDQQRRGSARKKAGDRRRNRIDRRRSVRDGIVVTLSEKVERRQRPDRRKGAV